MNWNSKAAQIGIGVAVAAVAIYFIAKKSGGAIGDAVDDLAKKLDPTSDQNIFYRGVNAVGDVIDDGNRDNDSFSLGSKIYDVVDWAAGWFGQSDADKQRRAEEAARADRLNQDEAWLRADSMEHIGL